MPAMTPKSISVWISLIVVMGTKSEILCHFQDGRSGKAMKMLVLVSVMMVSHMGSTLKLSILPQNIALWQDIHIHCFGGSRYSFYNFFVLDIYFSKDSFMLIDLCTLFTSLSEVSSNRSFWNSYLLRDKDQESAPKCRFRSLKSSNFMKDGVLLQQKLLHHVLYNIDENKATQTKIHSVVRVIMLTFKDGR